MSRKPFTDLEKQAIQEAEAAWMALSQVRSFAGLDHDDQLLKDLKAGVSKTIKALDALGASSAKLTRAALQAELSALHSTTPEAVALFPGAPIEYRLVRKGRSYLGEELQRLQLLHQVLQEAAPKRGPKPDRELESFIFLAADRWKKLSGKVPAANGRFLDAIHEFTRDQRLKSLTEDFTKGALIEWKKRPI